MTFFKFICSSIQSLFARKEESLASVLVKGVSGTFVLKVWYALWLFGVNLLLARMLGIKDFGIYSIAISWSALATVLAKLGQEQIVCRYIAGYRENGDYANLRGIVIFSIILVAVAGAFLAFCGVLVIDEFFSHLGPDLRRALRLAFWLVPLQALITAVGAVLQGLSKVIRAQIPNLFVSPIAFLVILAFTTDLYKNPITAVGVIAVSITSHALALGVLILSARSALSSVIPYMPASYRIREWIAAVLPVTLMGGMYVINMNADIVMLGAFASADAAGIYKAATRGADLVIFSLMIINPVLSPIISKLHTAGDRIRLQRGITRVARVGLLLSLPIALFLLIFGEWFLSLFGPGFAEGYISLSILSIGQVVNVASGSVAIILVMTGNERIAAMGVAVSTLVNISLNTVLIPVWGIEGAAIATATSIILWNVLLVRFVWKLLGVDPTSFGFLIRSVKA